jgi:hypothetical protein
MPVGEIFEGAVGVGNMKRDASTSAAFEVISQAEETSFP